MKFNGLQVNPSSQEAKDKKMSLEELKKMGRAERQRMREERRRQKSDSDSESEYLVGKLAEIVRVDPILINFFLNLINYKKYGHIYPFVVLFYIMKDNLRFKFDKLNQIILLLICHALNL